MNEDDKIWTWKNTRSVNLEFLLILAPWEWRVTWVRDSDCYGHTLRIQFGPFCFSLLCDISNCSAEGWQGKFGLSECEAWERSKSK